MKDLKSSYDFLLKTQEKFFEELADSLKKDFYYVKNVIDHKSSVSFDLDESYLLSLEDAHLVLTNGNFKYRIYNLDDLYIYLKIRSSSIEIGD